MRNARHARHVAACTAIRSTHLYGTPTVSAARRMCSTGSTPITTFVSTHYRLEPGVTAAFLERHGLSTRDTPTHTIVRACPLCGKPHGDKVDNLWKLYVRKADGAYFCHRCGSGGSWFDLKMKLGDSMTPGSISDSSRANGSDQSLGAMGDVGLWPRSAPTNADRGRTTVSTTDVLSPSVETIFRARDALLVRDEFPAVLAYLTGTRGLSREVLREYCIGAMSKTFGSPVSSGGDGVATHECVVFPWLLPHVDGKAGHDSGALTLGGRSSNGARITGATSVSFPAGNPELLQPPSPVETVAKMLHANSAIGTSTGMTPQAALSSEPLPSLLSCLRYKLRSVTDKSKQALAPKGGSWGLFGLHTVPREARSIVLTEGEFDAMAVRQSTGAPAVSLPNGCRSLPLEVLPMLERFDRLYLWMDDDAPGREGCDRIATKLGLGRCHIVRPTAELLVPAASSAAALQAAGGVRGGCEAVNIPVPKDANEALQRGLDLKVILAAAAPRPHDQIVSFRDLRDIVMLEVEEALGIERGGAGNGRHRTPSAGVPIRCLPRLQQLLKGHRPGEVTVVTGPTGSGKTTLLSQLSLDLAAQGVPTLWGSFEIKATRLIAGMLAQLRSGRVVVDPETAPAELLEVLAAAQLQHSVNQISRRDAETKVSSDGSLTASSTAAAHAAAVAALADYEHAADVLSALPMSFLRFYGSTDVDRVLDALEYAAYAHDVRHVVLDNLQFMMSATTTQSRGFDKFDAQDRALDRFRAFATRRDVHLTLVIHPRKEADDEPLSMSSVFGGAKATQEADSVLILQRERDGRKYVDVKKNRYDGSLGRVYVDFDATAKCFVDATPSAETNGSAGGSGSSSSGSGSSGSRTSADSPWTSRRGNSSRGGDAAQWKASTPQQYAAQTVAGKNGTRISPDSTVSMPQMPLLARSTSPAVDEHMIANYFNLPRGPSTSERPLPTVQSSDAAVTIGPTMLNPIAGAEPALAATAVPIPTPLPVVMTSRDAAAAALAVAALLRTVTLAPSMLNGASTRSIHSSSGRDDGNEGASTTEESEKRSCGAPSGEIARNDVHLPPPTASSQSNGANSNFGLPLDNGLFGLVPLNFSASQSFAPAHEPSTTSTTIVPSNVLQQESLSPRNTRPRQYVPPSADDSDSISNERSRASKTAATHAPSARLQVPRSKRAYRPHSRAIAMPDALWAAMSQELDDAISAAQRDAVIREARD